MDQRETFMAVQSSFLIEGQDRASSQALLAQRVAEAEERIYGVQLAPTTCSACGAPRICCAGAKQR